MVNTEELIEKTLVKLMDKYEIEEIDVNMICKTLSIKRQTFYYHYKNIYDVIYAIYCKQKISDLLPSDINSLISAILTFLYKDQSFNLSISKSNASDVLREFIGSYISTYLNKNLEKYNLSIDNKREISRFYSFALSQQCLYYFELEYSVKDTVLKISNLFNEDILKSVIRKCQNSFL